MSWSSRTRHWAGEEGAMQVTTRRAVRLHRGRIRTGMRYMRRSLIRWRRQRLYDALAASLAPVMRCIEAVGEVLRAAGWIWETEERRAARRHARACHRQPSR